MWPARPASPLMQGPTTHPGTHKKLGGESLRSARQTGVQPEKVQPVAPRLCQLVIDHVLLRAATGERPQRVGRERQCASSSTAGIRPAGGWHNGAGGACNASKMAWHNVTQQRCPRPPVGAAATQGDVRTCSQTARDPTHTEPGGAGCRRATQCLITGRPAPLRARTTQPQAALAGYHHHAAAVCIAGLDRVRRHVAQQQKSRCAAAETKAPLHPHGRRVAALQSETPHPYAAYTPHRRVASDWSSAQDVVCGASSDRDTATARQAGQAMAQVAGSSHS